MTKYEVVLTFKIESQNEQDIIKEFVKSHGLTILDNCDKYNFFRITPCGMRSLIKQERKTQKK